MSKRAILSKKTEQSRRFAESINDPETGARLIKLAEGTRPKRYFFDIRDGNELAADEEGLELPDVEAALEEAARSWRT